MARKSCRASAATEQTLTCLQTHCGSCGYPIKVAYRTQRTITTLQGSCRLILRVRRCHNPACEWYHRAFRPEEEGKWALPHGEFGLDVIALVGTLRYISHRSVPEIHQALRERGISIAERTVTHLLQRYEELVALRLIDPTRLGERFKEQGQVILALDGLQPDVGHEVLWIVRDCLSGEVLLARSMLSACESDLANLLREVQQVIDVPIRGVISDGQRSIRNAVQTVLPDVPHQLCHFHYLREAAKPIYEADKHAKKELKKHIRGVRPIERAVEKRQDGEAEVICGYCLAVRSAVSDPWTREELGQRSGIERFFGRVFLFFHLQRPPLSGWSTMVLACCFDLHRYRHRRFGCSTGGASRSHPLSHTRFSSCLGGFLSYEMPSPPIKRNPFTERNGLLLIGEAQKAAGSRFCDEGTREAAFVKVEEPFLSFQPEGEKHGHPLGKSTRLPQR